MKLGWGVDRRAVRRSGNVRRDDFFSEFFPKTSVLPFRYDRSTHDKEPTFARGAMERMQIAALKKQVLLAEPRDLMSLMGMFIVECENLWTLCCNKVRLSPWKGSMIHANTPPPSLLSSSFLPPISPPFLPPSLPP